MTTGKVKDNVDESVNGVAMSCVRGRISAVFSQFDRSR